jgi:hypothetical protein
MRITLINPRLAIQKFDFLGSGVPYWPVELATLAAFLRARGDTVSVVDLFGADPGRLTDNGDHWLQGEPLDGYADRPAVREADAFILFAISYMSHHELMAIAKFLKARRPAVPLAVLENSQAVTAYSLQRMASDFFAAGVDFLICGEPYFNWPAIEGGFARPELAPENVITRGNPDRPPHRVIVKTARYPMPAWDLFNLAGYWSIPYSHGPKTGRFLPVLTSRGCPYPCDFCVVPETNDRRWRGNEPDDVVAELLALRDRFGVRHFQVEDLNPTVNFKRWDDIARLLIARDAGIYFYFVSGTKAETVHLDMVPLLARAGCRYISISPESGSPELMKIIGKPFDYEHALALVAVCRANGIRTQACFLVGHPAETEADFEQSARYLRAMVRAGLDEVAVFIVASFAGSALYARKRIAIGDRTALPSFSPRGRSDYALLVKRRSTLLRIFFIEKARCGFDLIAQGVRSIFGRPQTKMENLPRRVLFVAWRVFRMRLANLTRS